MSDNSGDKIAVLESERNRGSKLKVLIVPGLGSSARAPNVERICALLEKNGVHVYRMNHRGSSDGSKLAKGIYHAGRYADVLDCLHYMKSKSDSLDKIVLVSMSLGSNMSLRALSNRSPDFISAHIAISPVVNLAESTQAIAKLYFGFFEKNFAKSINRYCSRRHRKFP